MSEGNPIPKGTAASKVFMWILVFGALTTSVLTPLSQIEFPEWWRSESDKTLIEHAVHKEFQNEFKRKYSEDSTHIFNNVKASMNKAKKALSISNKSEENVLRVLHQIKSIRLKLKSDSMDRVVIYNRLKFLKDKITKK